MIKQYLIQLIPQASFFFGSERTFGQGDDTNYFVKSNYFPQQTALLGMLRYMVLEKEGKLDKAATETQGLIGLKGFPNDDYGKIKSLSPLFIRYDEEGKLLKNFIVQAKDWAWQDDRRNGPIQLKLNEHNGTASTVTALDKLFIMEGYKAKNNLASLLIEANGKEWKEFDYSKDKKDDTNNGVFVAHQKVGISKTYAFEANGKKGNRKENEDEAFYRQTKYKLLPDYSFAFFARLETDADGNPPVKEGLTVFGAEKSPFFVKITEIENDSTPDKLFFELFSKAFGSGRKNEIILTSDACIDTAIFNHCRFSINAQTDFKHIITPENVVGKASYSAMSNDNSQYTKPYKSFKYNLIERGSIFYIKEGKIKEARKTLEELKYQTIGYNQFISYP